MLPSAEIKLLWERLSIKGIVPEGDCLNWAVKEWLTRMTKFHPNMSVLNSD